MEVQVHALHPIYMSLRALTDSMPADLQVPAVQCDLSISWRSDLTSHLSSRCQAIEVQMSGILAAGANTAKDKLAQADVDYEGTMAAKLMIARLLFDREGAALLQVCGKQLNAS